MRECPVCQYCFPDQFATCPNDRQQTTPTLPVETVIKERYRLDKRIGQGSVSIVYVAHDLIVRTTHAVKIILPELVGNDRTLSERFLREANAAAAVHHPNIVSVTASGVLNEGIPFVVMEYVSGPSLQETLSTRGALPPAEAFEYISVIASGLAEAHKHGIVHGDLKPRNILIEKDRPLAEAIKILDFGLSGIKSGKLHGPPGAAKPAGMLRSALYLAPEEWSDEDESDYRSDIYSLGIILYQMLAGDVPFKGRSNAAVMKQHLLNAPPPIVGPSGPIGSELEAVVQHALRKEPDQRPATVADFVEELRTAIAAGATQSHKVAKRAPRKQARGAPKASAASARRREKAVVEDRAEVEDIPQIDLQQTLVNQAIPRRKPPTEPEASPAEPLPNFDQTIVLPLPHRDAGEQEPFPFRDETLIGARSPQVEMAPALPEAETEFADEPEVGYEDEDVEEVIEDVPDWSDQELEPMPRSFPPLLLAAGVVLIIVLIGVGIYYSNASQ